MLQIGNLTLENGLIMAPMAGITNLPFRLMVKRLGAGLVTSEMVSAMGLIRGKGKTLDYLKSHPAEKPLAVQIFGSKPDVMACAAGIVVEAGANVVDINMGCPVKKVVKIGAGAALLRDPKKVGELVSAVRLACPVPLTVKIRAGWSPEQPNACEIAHIIEDCGADAITVHPRFAKQRYSVPADWSIIRQVKAKSNIPVIGNGDVFEPASAIKMKKETGCDGVMIGRGAVGNPWLFKQILKLEKGLVTAAPTLSERRALIMAHFMALTDTMGENRAALVMRGLLLWYSKGLPRSGRFRGHISKIKDLDSLTEIMDEYFSSLQDDDR